MSNNLLVNFYSELSSTFSEQNQNSFSSEIELNPEHEIFKGHFEQMPVAPGVCLVQIVKEIVMDKFQINLQLSEGKNIKYLALIVPTQNKNFVIDFTVYPTENGLNISANYTNNGTSFTKMKLIFKEL